jgi:hypothetical protein
MSKRSSKKSKRRSKAVPALGITGLSLSLASGAIASTGGTTTVGSTSQPHEIFLGEEEVFDTSLSTFYTFDKENGEQTSLAQHLKLAAHGGCGGGGCGCGGRGCGGGGGCAAGARGCAGGGGCAAGVRGCAAGVRGCAAGVRGCAAGVRGCARGFHVHCRCAFFRRCFGCGCSGCGGCWGCGTCWIWTPTWGWINTCWSESTPAGEETRVASEQITQTTVAEEKK